MKNPYNTLGIPEFALVGKKKLVAIQNRMNVKHNKYMYMSVHLFLCVLVVWKPKQFKLQDLYINQTADKYLETVVSRRSPL